MRSKGALNLKINESEYHKNRERKKKEKKKKRKKGREKEEKKEEKKEKRMPTAPGVPRRSPIQVLTGPDVA